MIQGDSKTNGGAIVNKAKIGTDYGNGQANINPETGIRFGVIPVNALAGEAWDSLEAQYGDPHCPKCGNEVKAEASDDDPDTSDYERKRGACGDYHCDDCRLLFDGEDAFPDEVTGYLLDSDGYKGIVHCNDGDLFVTESPYYTHATFCSPCAPGACYLLTPTNKQGPRAYCLGHDWFEGDKAPYPVLRVSDGSFVKPGEV
jgi:hypothetical protein